MEAKELMVGDLVLDCDNRPVKIRQILKYRVLVDNIRRQCFGNIKPIPLTVVRQCIAIIRDKAGEYVDYGDWESAIPFGTPPSFNEEKFIQENFDIAPKATIAEILAKTETNNKIEE